MSKIYVGNVAFDHDPRDLEEQFAKAAVNAMEGYEFYGRRLRVSRNLFVANIAPDVKLSELEEFFEAYGKIENIKILPQARGNSAMSAFVDFEDVVAAQPRARLGACAGWTATSNRLQSPKRARTETADRDDYRLNETRSSVVVTNV
ncbi:hypothetical protein PINS_up021866, partial [Pythium insidiosum]